MDKKNIAIILILILIIACIGFVAFNSTRNAKVGSSQVNIPNGYKINANRFLLWEAIKYLKGSGYEWFDMGGIDLINTKNVAEFKLGVGCSYENLLGEYVSI